MIENIEIYEIIAALVLGFSALLILYSHLFYPLILRVILKKETESNVTSTEQQAALPHITIVIPAYNEEKSIRQKIHNLYRLDYPHDKFDVILYDDGSTDQTSALARAALSNPLSQDVSIRIISAPENSGKVAVLNRIIPQARGDIVVLSDVSALLSVDALSRLVPHFAHKEVGVVAGTYHFSKQKQNNEQSYWAWQRAIKRGENALGALIGCHGAFYAFRKALFVPLAPDTINDDFILPMMIQQAGFKGIYDPKITVLELEGANVVQDYARRVRISIGNIQQLFRLFKLLHPKFGGLAFAFFSSKVLRTLTPLLMVFSLLASVALSIGSDPFFQGVGRLTLLTQFGLFALSIIDAMRPFQIKLLARTAYVVRGQLAGLHGWVRYLRGTGTAWASSESSKSSYIPHSVRFSKRLFDVIVAVSGLVILAPFFPLIMVMIRLDSPGPALFKQRRVGLSTRGQTHFFDMIKFRTMHTDAEEKTGAVWAQKNDPRITRLGRFLRKTRLDELPQLWNVLTGEMSLIGPRPERPELYGKLEKAVPFFTERNFGLRPGITGPAQVFNGYDATIEDVRNKAAWDHAYALQLCGVRSWVSNDVEILIKTIGVMIGRRGQ